jgi:hypothetical protein
VHALDPQKHQLGREDPIRPLPETNDDIRRSFVRGRKKPRGVVWFGITSFWGHLRHFVSAAIATEDIDSRDWMTPDDPLELAQRVIAVLGGDASKATISEALGRDLWIDYVADTGDDVSVSAAVAELLTAEYELPDPDHPSRMLIAPRGELLLFGGDTAYPVATAKEITNRVLVPFNHAIERRRDEVPRVLLGIPGNHDWYDGLDGFQRMFRRREGEDQPRPSMLGVSKKMLEHYTEWARELVLGGKVDKPPMLVLSGYTPLQNASFFVLPLAPNIHLFAADRQLKTIDSRQRTFLSDWYHAHPNVAPWVLLPDPLYAFGAPSPTGTRSVQALELDFEERPHFLLSGDVHHYERLKTAHLLHVTSGGGGAFLHPAPMFESRLRADVRFPNAAQSRALLRLVPWKVALGRSGFIPHLAIAGICAPSLALAARLHEQPGHRLFAPLLILALSGTVYALIGGVRLRARAIIPLAYGAGLITATLPLIAWLLVRQVPRQLHVALPLWAMPTLTLIVTAFLGAWVFGAYLALLTRLGLEHTQAFTALDHPGFKHFLRLRVRADGRGVDGFCIGLVDPLRSGEKPVMVDHFEWRPNEEWPRVSEPSSGTRSPPLPNHP